MSRTNQVTTYQDYQYEDSPDFVKLIKNEPLQFDDTPRVLLLDGDSLLFQVIYFPLDGLIQFDTDEEYIEEAKHRLREKVQEITINIEKWFNIKQTLIFQGGKNNFRYRLSNTYKSNRPKEKPKYFTEIKEYAKEIGFITCNGHEADDAIYQCYLTSNKQCVISAIDKDILAHCCCVPIYDFKIRKEVIGEFKYTTETQARLAQATQYLIGDSGDGVGGARGVGKKYAEQHLHETMTNYQFIKAILNGYIKSTKDVREAKKQMKLTYNLLRLYTIDEINSLNLDKI